MTGPFQAPRWLRSPHLQTLGAAAPLFAPPRPYGLRGDEAMRIPLGHEGHALHARAWWASGPGRRSAIVVVHGIGGSSGSAYVVRSAVALHRAGFHVVRLDLRGAGASIPDAPSLYHAGLSADLAVVGEHLARDPRVDGVAFLGFSGGGSLALRLAGADWGGAPPGWARAIVSVSAPLDYTRVAARMDRLGCLPYRFHVLRGLVRGARSFARHHPSRATYRPEDVRRMSSFREYDERVIVPMHGFASVDAYRGEASAGPWLGHVAVPTMLVHSEDDPMVPIDTVRPWLAGASHAVDVALSRHGGHIGWVEGWDEASWVEAWPVRRALAFLARHARAEAAS